MNDQHKHNRRANRRKRLQRRLFEVEDERIRKAKDAESKHYEADLSGYYSQIRRLKARAAELEPNPND